MAESSLRQRYQEELAKNPFLPTYSVVVNVLKNEVYENRLKAGDRLKEIETAEKLGVSRSTVRRAFDTLVLDGIFIRHENRGVEVAEIMSSSYRELMEIRIMLDASAAKLAAMRRDETDLKNMLDAINLVYDPDSEDGIRADNAFHKTVYEAAKNRFILKIYSDFDMEIIRARYHRAMDYRTHKESITADHMAIYEAIRDHDIDRAEEASRYHTAKLLDPALVTDLRLLQEEE